MALEIPSPCISLTVEACGISPHFLLFKKYVPQPTKNLGEDTPDVLQATI